jgi:hypothetical protein
MSATPLQWGVHPRSSRRGVMHATEEQFQTVAVVTTMCHLTVRLVSLTFRAEGARPCKRCAALTGRTP